MPRVEFDAIPDDARLWVFGVGDELGREKREHFLARVDGFLEVWAAHGSPLRCARDFRHGRFLLVAVDEASVPPSGCSIDSMVRLLKELEVEIDTSLVDNTPVWYRDDGGVHRVSRADFRRHAEEGRVDADTLVFDNTITRVGQLEAGEWERRARDSWHGRAFFRDAPAR